VVKSSIIASASLFCGDVPPPKTAVLIDDIRELLATPPPAETRSFLDVLDATLTSGYAAALQLEAERWRLERKIGEVAARFGDEQDELSAEELAALTKQLTAANENITSLRSVLGELRDRRRELREAA
jgi:chromosome segregation ATPase